MPTKPSAASPFGAIGETMDFMQKMWGGMGMPTPGNTSLAGMPQRMPSMLAPTIDVDELDKRIADLRAVQQWLELNAGMLRTTIQTLEVQRATIATLKGISGAMLAPIVGAGETPSATRVPPEVTAGLLHDRPAGRHRRESPSHGASPQGAGYAAIAGAGCA